MRKRKKMINNDKGHSLIEILVVLLITSTLLLFFSNSLLNNLRFINKYQQNTVNYTILRLNQKLIPLLQTSISIKEVSAQYECEVPRFEKEDKYTIEKTSFHIKDDQLFIKESGDKEREKRIKLNNIRIQIDIEEEEEKQENKHEPQSIVLQYSLSNQILHTYNLKNHNYKHQEKK